MQSVRSRLNWHTAMIAVAVVLLALWSWWWGASIARNQLARAERTWVPAVPLLGLDFLNNYHASRHWLAGGDPYREPFGDPWDRKFCYPPMVLPAFSWTAWFAPQSAVWIWMGILVGLAMLGTWAAMRARRQLDLERIPWLFALAAFVFCTPFLFALERGNYDLLLIALILPAAWGLSDRSLWREGLAGVCLALAVVLKLYPAFLVLGLIPLRRWRVLACCAVAGAGFGLFGFSDLPMFQQNVQELMARVREYYGQNGIHPTVHTLSGAWGVYVQHGPLAHIPGSFAALGLILPLMLYVSAGLFRYRPSSRVYYPYFLWLTAAATFLPELANDYSLVFLPLAILAVWDRRDPVWVHMTMGLTLLWWQPVRLPIDGKLLLVFKLLALAAAAVSLMNRIRERRENTEVGSLLTVAKEPLATAA